MFRSFLYSGNNKDRPHICMFRILFCLLVKVSYGIVNNNIMWISIILLDNLPVFKEHDFSPSTDNCFWEYDCRNFYFHPGGDVTRILQMLGTGIV